MLTVWQEPARAKAGTKSEYVLAPDVVLVQVEDGTARVLNMGGGFYALPAIGAQMLQGVLEKGAAATIEDLARQYKISADQVQTDLHSVLHQLEQRGLLHKGPARRRSRASGPATILIPCLRLIRQLPCRVQAGVLLVLAYLSFALFGWARTVAVWQRCVRMMSPRGTPAADEQTIKGLDRSVRDAATGLPLRIACKERALSCWTLVCWAGMPATLIVGLELFPLGGHCWCEVGPWTLSDEPDRCRLFTPVLRYE
jgi:hypothetical protein